MTIKEIAERTGLAKANIRFYEAEGLIVPDRLHNGYRDYTQEHALLLERIKLLRTLHMSLEDIKAIQAGDRTLAQALTLHLEKLAQDRADLYRSMVICQGMQADGAEFATLDAAHYLRELEQAAHDPPRELMEDQPPTVKAPLLRFFARALDLTICSTLLNLVLLLLGRNHGLESIAGTDSFWVAFAALGLVYLVEPFLLARFGTTPGKAILGLRVTAMDGSLLTRQEARRRTGLVLVQGYGLNIPVWSWFCMIRSYIYCMDGKMRDWEEDSLLVCKPTKAWRAVVWVLVYLGLGLLLNIAGPLTAPPHNKGELTVEEFCENFEDLAEYHNYIPQTVTGFHLTTDGTWVQEEQKAQWGWFSSDPLPDFTFLQSDGVMTGLSIPDNDNDAELFFLAIQAFVPAQEEYPIPWPKDPLEGVLDELRSGARRVQMDLYGVSVCRETVTDAETGQEMVLFEMSQNRD